MSLAASGLPRRRTPSRVQSVHSGAFSAALLRSLDLAFWRSHSISAALRGTSLFEAIKEQAPHDEALDRLQCRDEIPPLGTVGAPRTPYRLSRLARSASSATS